MNIRVNDVWLEPIVVPNVFLHSQPNLLGVRVFVGTHIAAGAFLPNGAGVTIDTFIIR